MTTGIRWTGVCLDCADAAALAAFYERILGWPAVADDGAGWILLRDPAGGPSLSVQAEPWYEPPVWPEEPGTQAKMLHLELDVDDLEAAVGLVVEAGGREAPHQPADRDAARLRVMLDPAGHPFCLVAD